MVAGLALTVGVGVGVLAYTLTRPTSCTSTAGCPTGQVCVNGQCVSSSPTCTCASPDVCPTKGVCPSGYETDPSNSACCSPTSSTSSLLWSIGGSTGPISVDCSGDVNVCQQASNIQVTGLTPNGALSFYAALSPTALGQVNATCVDGNPTLNGLPAYFCPLNPNCIVTCPPTKTYVADAFGNYTSIWYALSYCCMGNCPNNGTECFQAPANSSSSTTYYIAVVDLATATMSNVISVTVSPFGTANQNVCGCGTP